MNQARTLISLSRNPLSRTHLACALAALVLLVAGAACAGETVVIVNAASPVATLDEDAATRIFLRQVKTFPDGSVAAPVNQKDNAVSEDFRNKVLKKNASQFKAYWAQQVFTGGAKPLQELEGDDAVVKYVAETPNGIGYVDASKVKGGVKVVLKK